jgi:hypothetical protein
MMQLTTLSAAHVQRNKIFLTILFCTVIYFLGIIHRPVSFLLRNVTETGFCLHFQVKA